MTGRASWIVLLFLIFGLLGSCTAMAGDVAHWPASLPWLVLVVAGKVANDRIGLLKWPMEFVFWSAITLILFNLVFLHFKPF